MNSKLTFSTLPEYFFRFHPKYDSNMQMIRTLLSLAKNIKAKIELKNWVYKEYMKNGRPKVLFYTLQKLTREISSYNFKMQK